MRLLGSDFEHLQRLFVESADSDEQMPTGIADVARIVAPDIPRAWWIKHARPWHLADLVRLFAGPASPEVAKITAERFGCAPGEWNGTGTPHDWGVVWKAIGFDEIGAKAQHDPVTPEKLTSALLAFCRVNPGYSVSDLLELRLEAFYLLQLAVIAEQKEAREAEHAEKVAEQEEVRSSVVPKVNDPAALASLSALIDEAERRAEGAA